jgi:hypothetical protein
MAQLGQKAHGFKDLDFLMVLEKAAAAFGSLEFERWYSTVETKSTQRKGGERILWMGGGFILWPGAGRGLGISSMATGTGGAKRSWQLTGW